MQKEINFNAIKIYKKVLYITIAYVTTVQKKIKVVYVTTFKLQQHNFNRYQQYYIFSMIIQNRTISVALTYIEGQTSKKAYKIIISQIALKLQS